MAKDQVEQSRRLDVGWFQRRGYLQDVPLPGRSTWTGPRGESEIQWTASAGAVWLHYKVRQGLEDWQAYDYPVHVGYTPLPRGGRRAWFHCPAQGCGRRCKVLYMPPAARVFACRRCHNLAYTAQQDRDELGKRDDWLRHEERMTERLARLLGRHQQVMNLADRLGLGDDPPPDRAALAQAYPLAPPAVLDALAAGVPPSIIAELLAVAPPAPGASPIPGLIPIPIAPAPVKRGRGRPRTKRRYTRRALPAPGA